MIPIRDINRSSRYPIVNTTIITINVLVYLWEISHGPLMQKIFFDYGLVPIRYTSDLSEHFSMFQQIRSFITFNFLHGGFLHLLGNMWMLYIFGDNVEDYLGHMRYTIFYMACGITAGIVHLLLNWESSLPTIGASGAIAGVMGAYLLLYPNAKVLTLIPIIFIPLFVKIPAYFFLGLWFFMQFLNATASGTKVGGIAWWAHVGGFLAGMAFVKLMPKTLKLELDKRIGEYTKRKNTPKLQTIYPKVNGIDLEGELVLSPEEAELGTRKFVNISLGFKSKTLKVYVPKGVNEGMKLRLKQQGLRDDKGRVGDLFLKIKFV